MQRLWNASASAAIALLSASAPALAQDNMPAAAAPALRGPMLTWPGKVTPRRFLRPAAAAVSGEASPAVEQRRYASRAAAPPPLRPSRYAASNDAPTADAFRDWQPVPPASARQREGYATRSASPTPAPVLAGAPNAQRLPSSIYDAPPSTRPVTQASQAYSPRSDTAKPAAGVQPVRTAYMAPPVRRTAYPDGVRFYSLHRQYGLTPDAAPIPPQFFASTPDLSDPPGPQSARIITVSGNATQAQLAARSAAEASGAAASGQP